MTDETIRTVVLAREGAARDRIIEGLGEAGADVVGMLDPAIAGPQDVRDLDPGAIVVALEPAIEDALERHADVLADPDVMVLFEETAVVLERSGWDAARWVRHLSAKLRRQADVLPPSLQQEADPIGEEPDAGADDAFGLSITFEGDDPASLDAPMAESSAYAFDPVAFEHGADDAVPTIELDPGLGAGLSLVDVDDGTPSVLEIRDAQSPVLDLDAAIANWSVDLPVDDDGVDDDAAPADADAVIASPDVEAPDTRALSLDDAVALPSFASASPSATPGDAPATALHRDLGALDARISGLSLADTDSYGTGPERGAVMVEGGLGGPDAVRQLIAAIPEGFPRPILVRLHLDGGRYDRLVRQMERATLLPVSLAEAGNEIAAGEIHFVTPDLDVVRRGGRLVFAAAAGGPSLPAALPADDSAVLFLSGSDAGLVDAAMAPAWAGALVAGQSPDGCYDPAAASAAIARGSASGTPVELADILLARWMPARASSLDTGGLSL